MPFCQKTSGRRSFLIPPFGARSKNPFDSRALNQAFPWLAVLRAWMVFAITLGSVAAVFAQDAAKPQTQASPSPAAQTPPGQTPPDQAANAPTPPKPVALYDLLQRKSVV